MDWIFALKAIALGIVEGLTEFLPVSSTGHLIVAEDIIRFRTGSREAFIVAIQAGAILAVCWEYRARIFRVLRGLASDATEQRLAINVVIAFLPAAVLGVLFKSAIEKHLFFSVPVAIALVAGGLVILWVERRERPARVNDVDDMRWQDALKIGFAQAFALIPGTSRSGATIIGGMLFGVSRVAATEFSFFLAIPTLFAATGYSLWKDASLVALRDAPAFGVGFAAAFVSAFACVRWLIRYVSHHDFVPFAWYRIVFGAAILATAYAGLVRWE